MVKAALNDYNDLTIAQRVERLVANVDSYVFPVNNDVLFETNEDLIDRATNDRVMGEMSRCWQEGLGKFYHNLLIVEYLAGFFGFQFRS